MYARLLALYRARRLTAEQLSAAVAKGWITAEQRDAILSGEG